MADNYTNFKKDCIDLGINQAFVLSYITACKELMDIISTGQNLNRLDFVLSQIDSISIKAQINDLKINMDHEFIEFNTKNLGKLTLPKIKVGEVLLDPEKLLKAADKYLDVLDKINKMSETDITNYIDSTQYKYSELKKDIYNIAGAAALKFSRDNEKNDKVEIFTDTPLRKAKVLVPDLENLLIKRLKILARNEEIKNAKNLIVLYNKGLLNKLINSAVISSDQKFKEKWQEYIYDTLQSIKQNNKNFITDLLDIYKALPDKHKQFFIDSLDIVMTKSLFESLTKENILDPFVMKKVHKEKIVSDKEIYKICKNLKIKLPEEIKYKDITWNDIISGIASEKNIDSTNIDNLTAKSAFNIIESFCNHNGPSKDNILNFLLTLNKASDAIKDLDKKQIERILLPEVECALDLVEPLEDRFIEADLKALKKRLEVAKKKANTRQTTIAKFKKGINVATLASLSLLLVSMGTKLYEHEKMAKSMDIFSEVSAAEIKDNKDLLPEDGSVVFAIRCYDIKNNTAKEDVYKYKYNVNLSNKQTNEQPNASIGMPITPFTIDDKTYIATMYIPEDASNDEINNLDTEKIIKDAIANGQIFNENIIENNRTER